MCFGLVLSVFYVSSIALAEDTNAIDPEVYVTKVSVDKASYKVGETVNVSADFLNGTLSPVGSVSYVVTLGNDFDDAGNPSVVFDSKNIGKISLPAKGKVTEKFAYVIPQNTLGDKIKVQISAVLPSGYIMGIAESPVFSVSGGKAILNTNTAFIEVLGVDGKSRGEQFPLAAGVSINKDKSPNARVTVNFSNDTKENLNLSVSADMFERSATLGKKIGSFDLGNFESTLGSKKILSFGFNVPTLDYKPGVYEGVLYMKDKSGVSRSEPITFHYIVQGDSAIIHYAKSDKIAVTKGELFHVSLLLSGEPKDEFFENKEKKTVATLKLVVTDKDGEVAQMSKNVEMGSFESSEVVELTATKDSSYLAVHATLTNKDGKLIAEYNEALSNSEIAEGTPAEDIGIFVKNKGMILFGIVVLVLLLSVLFYFKTSRVPVVIMVIGLGISVSVAFAQYQGGLIWETKKGDVVVTETAAQIVHQVKVYFDLPYDSMVFNPGSKILIRGHMKSYVCLNTQYGFTAYFGNGDKEISDPVKIGSSAASSSHAEKWMSKNFSYTVTAPMTPGDYNASIRVRRSEDASAMGFAGVGYVNRTAYQPYTVVDPSCPDGSCHHGGCPADSYYCDTKKACIPNGEVCNKKGTYTPDQVNPLIPRDLPGPVKLKSLTPKPTIVNKGDSCTISWENAFTSYDKNTVCEFTGPNISPVTFEPSTTDKIDYTSLPITSTTIYKMTCHQVDSKGIKEAGTDKSSEAICRLNAKYKEVH
jgi:hypothetical protein